MIFHAPNKLTCNSFSEETDPATEEKSLGKDQLLMESDISANIRLVEEGQVEKYLLI